MYSRNNLQNERHVWTYEGMTLSYYRLVNLHNLPLGGIALSFSNINTTFWQALGPRIKQEAKHYSQELQEMNHLKNSDPQYVWVVLFVESLEET